MVCRFPLFAFLFGEAESGRTVFFSEYGHRTGGGTGTHTYIARARTLRLVYKREETKAAEICTKRLGIKKKLRLRRARTKILRRSASLFGSRRGTGPLEATRAGLRLPARWTRYCGTAGQVFAWYLSDERHLNERRQALQIYGSSPVWIRMCAFRFDWRAKSRPHPGWVHLWRGGVRAEPLAPPREDDEEECPASDAIDTRCAAGDLLMAGGLQGAQRVRVRGRWRASGPKTSVSEERRSGRAGGKGCGR